MATSRATTSSRSAATRRRGLDGAGPPLDVVGPHGPHARPTWPWRSTSWPARTRARRSAIASTCRRRAMSAWPTIRVLIARSTIRWPPLDGEIRAALHGLAGTPRARRAPGWRATATLLPDLAAAQATYWSPADDDHVARRPAQPGRRTADVGPRLDGRPGRAAGDPPPMGEPVRGVRRRAGAGHGRGGLSARPDRLRQPHPCDRRRRDALCRPDRLAGHGDARQPAGHRHTGRQDQGRPADRRCRRSAPIWKTTPPWRSRR